MGEKLSEQEALFITAGVTTITNSAFARLVGCTEGAIRLAIKRGELTGAALVTLPSGRVRLNEDEALRQWRVRHSTTEDGAAPAEFGGGASFSEAKARRETALARRAEIELAELEGRMHRAEDVRAAVTGMIAACRAKLRALPAKLAGALSLLTDPAEINAVLTGEVHEVLTELSEYDPAAYRRGGKRRNEESWPDETD